MSDNKKSLRTLLDEAHQIESMLVESGGELTPEIEALVALNEKLLPQKVDNCVMLVKRMDLVASQYKEMAEQFMRMAKSAMKVSERVEENILQNMQLNAQSELIGGLYRYKVQNNPPSVRIDSEAGLPGEYLITETITKVDRRSLISALKEGKEIEGAELVVSQRAQAYVNTKG